jgi:hypothetical protein
MTAFNLFADNAPPVEQGEEDLGGPIILYPKGVPRPGSARFGKVATAITTLADLEVGALAFC